MRGYFGAWKQLAQLCFHFFRASTEVADPLAAAVGTEPWRQAVVVAVVAAELMLIEMESQGKIAFGQRTA